jgi:hypothetical protein
MLFFTGLTILHLFVYTNCGRLLYSYKYILCEKIMLEVYR